MRLIRGLRNLKSQFRDGSVATIGNYDGIHLGHQQILAHLSKKAQQLKLPAVVIIFEPQPEEFFFDDAPGRLSSMREKINFLINFKLDAILVLPFNAKLAELTASDFCQKILGDALHVRYLIVGDDFVFGHRREGDYKFLQSQAAENQFEVEQIKSFKIDGVRVSSTLIRTALLHGELKEAAKFLGRNFAICGRVTHGDKFGRDLGFPTANVNLSHRVLPLNGVVAVKIHGIDSSPKSGIANIGIRPTVGDNKRLLEVYIFNFAQDIYGKMIEVEFIAKIREERKFSSFEVLQKQIENDIVIAQRILKDV